MTLGVHTRIAAAQQTLIVLFIVTYSSVISTTDMVATGHVAHVAAKIACACSMPLQQPPTYTNNKLQCQ